MNPLPERRKTPEELAELRQSLGIPPTAQDGESDPAEPSSDPPEPAEAFVGEAPLPAINGAPERDEGASTTTEAKDAVPGDEDSEKVVRVEVPRPMRTLRKSASLPVDQPKQQVARGDSQVIPAKRHSDEELNRIRKAAQLAPPVGDVMPKVAHLAVLLLLYGTGSVMVLATVLGAISQKVPLSDLPFDWLIQANQMESLGMILFGILCAGALVFGASAGWLALARPLSRHHAGFMTIIAVLVLVFGTLYFFPELHAA